MGSSQSRANKISVATLNYAGITYSPFQFYSGSAQDRKEMQDLSKNFLQFFQRQDLYKKVTGKKITNIDKDMQRQRYSPLYRRDVGIMNGRFMNRSAFLKKWNEQWEKNKHYVKFNQYPSQLEIQICQIFDYCVYKTFVSYIWSEKMKDNSESHLLLESQNEMTNSVATRAQKNRRNQAMKEYQKFLDQQFSKPYLKLDVKLSCIKQLVSKYNVVFLQDVSDQLINSLKNQGNINIFFPPGRDCAVLLKQNKFQQLFDQRKIFDSLKSPILTADQFNYDQSKKGNETTAVCFVDNFILISLHLTSAGSQKKIGFQQKQKQKTEEEKKEEEKKQIYSKIIKIMAHFRQIKRYYPSIHIIAAGDFKIFFRIKDIQGDTEQDRNLVKWFQKQFKVYPQDNMIKTTEKQRTRLQPQISKANIKDEQCRDFIISDLQMKNTKIQISKSSISNQNELLTEHHPFDHFIVSAVLST